MTEPTLLHQLFVKGRVAEAVTGRGLTPASLTLETLHNGVLRAVPVSANLKADGYFSLSLAHDRDVIEPPVADAITLRLTVALQDGRVKLAERAITGASLARTTRQIVVGGQTLHGVVIAGAPLALNLTFDPPPVSLYGTVIAGHDPTRPVAGAQVTAGPLGAQTDHFGNFRLGPLPPVASLMLNISKAGTSANYAFHPDFDKAVNLAAFSLDA